MAISGLLGQQNLQRLDLHFFPDNELYAASPSRVEIELSNLHCWLPAFLIQVSLADGQVLFPLLPAGEKQRRTLSLSLPARGYHPLPVPRISSRFPINFFIRSKGFQIEQQLLVFPRPLPGELPAGDGKSHPARLNHHPQPGIDGELRSIDAYREGDPLKAIHWKLSARHEDLVVKRLNRLGAPSLMLDLAKIPGSDEEKLSRCTYLVNHFLAKQQAVGLSLPDRTYPPALGAAQRYKLLTELALYGRR